MTRTQCTELASLTLPFESFPPQLYVRGQVVPALDGEPVGLTGTNIDLGTWFNAAPVGWWARIFEPGRLRLRVTGHGLCQLWGAHVGDKKLLESHQLDGSWAIEFDLTTQYDFMWITISSPKGAAVTSVTWSLVHEAVHDAASASKVTVVVPTFGRENDALDQVERLLGPRLVDVVGRVLVIDQGESVASSDRFESVANKFGARFELIEQGNFGGSGGYARGMIESQRFPDDAVLLLDDDAVIEPESLRRAFALSQALGNNTIVGTGLISSEVPTQLVSLAEKINRSNFNWGASDGIGQGQDPTTSGPHEWSYLDPQATVDYSGWWGTLIPAGGVTRIGLPAPFFLKWDDAEYGIRAENLGFKTVTLPGVSVWHPTWAAKGTVSSWSSWPMHRNRLTVAAAYGAGRGVIFDSLIHQIKHILSLQYVSADLWNRGIEQLLTNSDWLTSGLIETREIAQSYIDSLPKALPGTAEMKITAPMNLALQGARAVAGLFRPISNAQSGRCEGIDYTWQKSMGMDVFLIERSTTSEVLLRDPKRARGILKRTLKNHFRLLKGWRALQGQYGLALPRATMAWSETFDG